MGKKPNYDELLILQKIFIFIPTDKAGNNITLVCKIYFMETLKQEICTYVTFIRTIMTTTDVSSEFVNCLKQYGVKSSGKIPLLY